MVVGFDGPDVPQGLLSKLSAGLRGGVILFRRNLPTLEIAGSICATVAKASPSSLPPWIGVDEEGGRVRRLPMPVLALPSMRRLGFLGGPALVETAARALARELAAIGFNINFAPVLDVDTNPANPVIGDRAFGSDPGWVASCALAYLRGTRGLVATCGKHFPGHGDTDLDSHLDLPRLAHDRQRLDMIEFVPFRAAIEQGIDAIMSAHVVVSPIDPLCPATLSYAVATDLLRNQLRFGGVLFSDDLEMKAIAEHWTPGEAAVMAVAAGCDVLLVCHREETQAEIHEALVRETEKSPAFYARCIDAARRALVLRQRLPPRPVPGALLRDILDDAESRSAREQIQRACAAP
jgi:beta-N-acetylhexosaminidase